MEGLADLLEQELEEAVEVKNKKSLHRYILLLTDNLVRQDRFENNLGEIKSDVRVIAESMKQGFASMEKRFEDVNRRFEDVNHRFDDVNKRFEDVNHRFNENSKKSTTMFTYLNIILGVLVLITVLFKFI